MTRMPKDYRDIRAAGFVSVWVGSFAEDWELDDYLRETFAKDFGVKIDAPRIGEITAVAEPTDIANLVNGFSCWKTFDKACVEAALAKGITRASCMFVAYDLKYDERDIENPAAPITFVGTIPYSGFR